MKKRLSASERTYLKDMLLTTALSFSNIAEQLGISPSTVTYYATKYRAKAVRKKLKKETPIPGPRTILRRNGRNITTTDTGEGLYYTAAARFFDSIYRGPR